MSQLLTDQLENASELLEAANSLQGPSPFPTPTPTSAMPAANAISDAVPNPANGDIEFDFRPYLDNQYFESCSYNNQGGVGSCAESFLLPQDFERLFCDPVKPAMCPSAMKYVREIMQDYPLELLELPHDNATNCSPVGVA